MDKVNKAIKDYEIIVELWKTLDIALDKVLIFADSVDSDKEEFAAKLLSTIKHLEGVTNTEMRMSLLNLEEVSKVYPQEIKKEEVERCKRMYCAYTREV